MYDARRPSSLEMRWLPVRTPSGRICMEAVWVTVDPAVDSAVDVTISHPAGRGHAA